MKEDDPAAYLYDHYTSAQLKAIAKQNNVLLKSNTRKLAIAKAIVEQTDGKYELPNKDMPLSNKLYQSRVSANNPKQRNEHRDEQRRLRKREYEEQLTEDELANSEDYQRIIRFIDGERIPEPGEKVAVYSDRNLSWDGVGTLTRGYNFITKEESDKWLRLRGVRKATAEEVSSYFDI